MAQVNSIELYRALSELARRYQFRNRDEVCCYGLTVSQCYALQSLVRQPFTSGRLSEALGLDISSTTRLVDQLVRKKLVLRKRSAEDGRVKNIEITEAGHKLVTRIESDLANVVGEAVKGLSAEVQRALPEVIRRLNHALACSTDQKIVAPESIRLNSR
ncbi:MAG TPA: MarR family transcriptional regulator [Acidobacteriota bacterium]|jgi:DNA-binding MarR family transcriptional regulator